MRKPAADKLMQRVGVAVVTGAVLLSQVPAQAIASEAGSSAAPQTASQASAQSEPQQQSDSANPPEPPSGGVATDRGGGNISVDGGTISTEGTTWAGAASIEQNTAGSTSDAPMTVNIDGSSQWTVTADSTVSSLNVAEGAKVVDADGKTVTIVAGGQTVVQGDSGLTVTVTGSYSTDYDASEAGSLTSETIDRTAYDDAFGTDVDDASSDEKDATSQASTASDTDSGSSSDAEKGFFAQVVDWLKSLFGM